MDADAGARARAVRRQRGHGPPRARTQRRRRVARASAGRPARPLATHREWAPHDDRRARARVLVPERTRRLERAVALPRRDDIRRAHAQPRAPASRVGRFRLAVARARDQPARRTRSRGGADPRAARARRRRDLVPGDARIDRAVEARDHRRLGPRRPRRSLCRVRVRHRGTPSLGRTPTCSSRTPISSTSGAASCTSTPVSRSSSCPTGGSARRPSRCSTATTRVGGPASGWFEQVNAASD